MSENLTAEALGRELELHFRRKGVSQTKVAEKIGVKQSWIARIYAGNFTRRSLAARKMCKLANLPFEGLMEAQQLTRKKAERNLEGLLSEVWEGTEEDAQLLVDAIKVIKQLKRSQGKN